MQIQPHYLYNTLDIIRMTALQNEDEQTASLIESLSKQMRYVIGQQNETVPLYRELDAIKE
jgi:two-component system sensor histidine kinase YesM